MSHVTVCALVTVIALVLGVRGGQVFDCSDKVVQEFAFGVPFKADVAELINRRFTSEHQCAKLSDYLWQEVADYCGRDLWQSSDEAARQRIGGNIIQLVHYRAGKVSAANRTDAQKEVEAMFKLNLFEGVVFELTDRPSSCAGQVQRALQLQQPFAAPLTRYLDGFSHSDCAAFEKKIKSMFSQVLGLSKIEWLALSVESKRTAVEALFRLLYAVSGAKRPWSGTERTVARLARNPALIGDIFASATLRQANGTMASQSTAKSSFSLPKVIFWASLVFLALAVLFMSLRFFEVIP